MKKVPSHIVKTDYADTSMPVEEMQSKYDRKLIIYNDEEIARLRECGIIARKALDTGARLCKVGVTTNEIDNAVHDFIIENGGYPSPLNYHGFPKSLCTSVNEVICHGIPDDRPLQDGDIINLDITVYYKGMHVDLNETYCVGEVKQEYKDLIYHTYKSLEAAMDICKPGTMFRQLGNEIALYIEKQKLSVVKSYCGHGTGKLFHCAPNVPHYKKNKAQGIMEKGMCFTIEPMVNQGSWRDITWPDNWTAVTSDGKRSAQFEHTMLVTDDGIELLSARLPDSVPLSFELGDKPYYKKQEVK